MGSENGKEVNEHLNSLREKKKDDLKNGDHEIVYPIWERQAWETDKAYSAFSIYLHAHPSSRSVRDSYHKYLQLSRGPNTPKPKLANGTWMAWSHGAPLTWVERVRAYDKHVSDERQRKLSVQLREDAEVWASRRRQVLEMHYAVGLKMVSKVFDRIDSIDEATPWELARLAAEGSKLLRVATNISDGRREVDVRQWQAELSDAGVDSNVIFDQLVDTIAKRIESDVVEATDAEFTEVPEDSTNGTN